VSCDFCVIFATLLHNITVRLSVLILFFSIIIFRSSAQDCLGFIHGNILNEDGDALPQAAVSLQKTQFHSISDVNGSFVFRGVCPGTYTLEVTYIGYESQSIETRVPSSETLTVIMVPSSTFLQDVTIEASQATRSASQTFATLEDEALATLHGKPLGEALKEIPGVNALQTGPSIFKPVIDGLHSQRILILNNGIRQEGQQWGIEHAPEVDPFIASQIQVLKGAETVRYGSAAMGGVIIISPPPLHQTEKIGGEMNVGLMSNNRMGVFSALVEGTLLEGSGWSWRLQSSVKKGGDYHTPTYSLSNTGLNEFNFSGAVGYEGKGRGMEIYLSSFNTEIGILRAAHTGNLRDLQQSIETGMPWFVDDFTYGINHPKQNISHHLVKVSAYQRVKDVGMINILYGGQYDHRREFDIRRSGRNARPSLSLNLISNVLDISLDHEHAAHSGSVGINGTVKANTNDTEATGIRPLLPDYQQVSGGLFVLEKWKNEKWIVEAGARYDFQHLQVRTFINNQELIKPEFNFNFLSGTLGATVLFNPQLRLLSNLGMSSRPPHVSELYSEGLHHGTASIEEGLMRKDGSLHTEQSMIKKEFSKKWISTLQYTDEKISADVSVYYNDIDNYVYIRPTGTRFTVRGYFPVFQYQQTDAVLTGSDATIKWKVTDKLTLNSKFSYIYARDTRHDNVLIYIPPAQFENGLTFSWPSVGKLEKFYVGVSVPATFQQGRAPMVVRADDIGANGPDETFDFAQAPKGYVLVNARLGFQIPVREHHLGITLAGENLFNTSYRNYMNRLRYYADDVGSNFILRLSYNFLSH
jgi:Outer membrane receptor proteins, mostly Fe transport